MTNNIYHPADLVPLAGGILDGVDAVGDVSAPVQDATVDRRLDEVFVAHPRSIPASWPSDGVRGRTVVPERQGGAPPHTPS